MAYSVSHIIGPDFNNAVQTNTNSAGTAIPVIGPLGLEAFGSDGKLYVLAQVGTGVSVPASTGSLTINATTFQVTLTGGSYTSPATALAAGDVAWFYKASV
jgi:hypothetical protein